MNKKQASQAYLPTVPHSAGLSRNFVHCPAVPRRSAIVPQFCAADVRRLDLHPRPLMESTHRHNSVSDHDGDHMHQDSASDSTEATASCRALQAPDKLQQHRVGSDPRACACAYTNSHNFVYTYSVLQFFLMSCKCEQSVQQNIMTWLASMHKNKQKVCIPSLEI